MRVFKLREREFGSRQDGDIFYANKTCYDNKNSAKHRRKITTDDLTKIQLQRCRSTGTRSISTLSDKRAILHTADDKQE